MTPKNLTYLPVELILLVFEALGNDYFGMVSLAQSHPRLRQIFTRHQHRLPPPREVDSNLRFFKHSYCNDRSGRYDRWNCPIQKVLRWIPNNAPQLDPECRNEEWGRASVHSLIQALPVLLEASKGPLLQAFGRSYRSLPMSYCECERDWDLFNRTNHKGPPDGDADDLYPEPFDNYDDRHWTREYYKDWWYYAGRRRHCRNAQCTDVLEALAGEFEALKWMKYPPELDMKRMEQLSKVRTIQNGLLCLVETAHAEQESGRPRRTTLSEQDDSQIETQENYKFVGRLLARKDLFEDKYERLFFQALYYLHTMFTGYGAQSVPLEVFTKFDKAKQLHEINQYVDMENIYEHLHDEHGLREGLKNFIKNVECLYAKFPQLSTVRRNDCWRLRTGDCTEPGMWPDFCSIFDRMNTGCCAHKCACQNRCKCLGLKCICAGVCQGSCKCLICILPGFMKMRFQILKMAVAEAGKRDALEADEYMTDEEYWYEDIKEHTKLSIRERSHSESWDRRYLHRNLQDSAVGVTSTGSKKTASKSTRVRSSSRGNRWKSHGLDDGGLQ
ncbi:hypothetical protein BJ508DRAFT_310306 [Ascobolus immersus RN42]|uniref:Uncharacterized protein n=1 Tax=Ascobolus immersus RN42 TaxID=1160509 RepID=A0A3N4HXK7_ASCIM|nr:hypothetical protein BJ508DRAFT_310306 [Ascobolus immersus RN42]